MLISLWKNFFLPMRQSLFSFSGAGEICLVHGLRQLTYDVKSGIRSLNFISDVTCATTKNTG